MKNQKKSTPLTPNQWYMNKKTPANVLYIVAHEGDEIKAFGFDQHGGWMSFGWYNLVGEYVPVEDMEHVRVLCAAHAIKLYGDIIEDGRQVSFEDGYSVVISNSSNVPLHELKVRDSGGVYYHGIFLLRNGEWAEVKKAPIGWYETEEGCTIYVSDNSLRCIGFTSSGEFFQNRKFEYRDLKYPADKKEVTKLLKSIVW